MIARQKKKPTVRDLLKIEIAQELGLWEKVQRWGWGELTAEEAGRIGGMMNRKMKERGKD